MIYSSKERVIVAIDTADIEIAKSYILQVKELCYSIKLGLEFFIANGLKGVDYIKENYDVPIFLDLKLNDIPNTVCKALKILCNHDLNMITVHINGGKDMLSRVADLFSNTKTKILGVTLLTSLNDDDINSMGMHGNVRQNVINFAKIAYESGLDGVISSGYEVNSIKKATNKKFLTVTPGIRILNSTNKYDDQKRVLSPKEALDNGADYLVIGRSITDSNDIRGVLSNMFYNKNEN